MSGAAPQTSAADLLFPLSYPPPLPTHSVAVKVTSAQLQAGRAAFLQRRRTLDDLYQFYESDLAGFLRAIYRAMVRAADA